jgi:uncharacterized protein YdhG (YjbR/CyaY superfamily)
MYLADLTAPQRTALEKLRRMIRKIVPKAVECISYRMPAFRVDGKIVAGFSARTNGCSYFPFSGRTLRALADDLEGYSRTKGALHFDPEIGLPAALVRKLLKEDRRDEVTRGT